jgi:hypothetical protein
MPVECRLSFGCSRAIRDRQRVSAGGEGEPELDRRSAPSHPLRIMSPRSGCANGGQPLPPASLPLGQRLAS